MESHLHLPTLSYGLWLCTILLQFLACWAVVKKGYRSNWKAFSSYLFFVTVQSVMLFAIAHLFSAEVYTVAYYIGGFTEAVLLSLVVLEVLVRILDPFEALPGRNIAWFCFWAVIGISSAVTLSMWRFSAPNSFGYLGLAIQRTIFLADAALLLVVLLQASSLGVSWRSSVSEIALGFFLFLSVQGVSRFVVNFFDNKELIRISGECGQAAYLIALTGWIWTMYHRNPLPSPLSTEAIVRMRAFASETLVTKERMFSVVGVKVHRVGTEDETEPVPEIVAH